MPLPVLNSYIFGFATCELATLASRPILRQDHYSGRRRIPPSAASNESPPCQERNTNAPSKIGTMRCTVG